MKQYLDLLQYVLDHGVKKSDRTGTGTLSVFGYQMRFDLQQGFPILTTKKLHWKSIVYELLWFLRGESSIRYLKDHNVSIWMSGPTLMGNWGLYTEYNGAPGRQPMDIRLIRFRDWLTKSRKILIPGA